MNVQKEQKEKIHFSLRSNIGKRNSRLTSCSLYNPDAPVVSECLSSESSVSNTIPKYL